VRDDPLSEAKMSDKPDERTVPDAPTPTQDEADALKVSAHGEGDPPDPATGPPVNVDVPFVSGTGAVGQELTTTMGNWDGEPTDYTGKWFSDGATHLGDGATYLIQASDVGHSITCVVTATNAFGSTDAPPSNAVMVS
jgi:hypothetical protein